MRVHVGCEFVQTAAQAVHTIVQVEPHVDIAATVISESWDVQTMAISTTYTDHYDNLCRRLTLPVGTSVLRYDAQVEVPDAVDEFEPMAAEVPPARVPGDALVYAMPSRFCPSDELGTFAYQTFGMIEPGWARVQTICDWVHTNIEFGYGNTWPTKTAADVLASRQGVCRDFAHLAVTICRSLNIPARYAFGYMPDIGPDATGATMDFCAWMEVYLGDRWYTFDPRNNTRRAGRVLIGRGRDALDVAMVTSFGGLRLDSMTVWADRVDEPT
ncbi:MAG: transglutaminase family protein [Ilumatobacteraceae bacterium]